MELIKKNKKIIMTGIGAFLLGFIIGEATQARSFEQQLAKNIFNQVTSSHGKLGSK